MTPALTIHDGAWAFCPTGADSKGHQWQPSDGLPLIDALRFTPHVQAPAPLSAAPAASDTPAPVTSGSKARPR